MVTVTLRDGGGDSDQGWLSEALTSEIKCGSKKRLGESGEKVLSEEL